MIKVTDEMIEASKVYLYGTGYILNEEERDTLENAIQSAIKTSEGLQHLKKCEACLEELVHLKKYKKINGEDKYYKDAKELAWANATKLDEEIDDGIPKEERDALYYALDSVLEEAYQNAMQIALDNK